MKDYLYHTIYDNEHYLVPYSEIGKWYTYMKDLSIFTLDCGNLQIQFSDAFHQYKTKP